MHSTKLEGTVPSITLKLSNTTLEEGTNFAAEQIKILKELLNTLAPSEEVKARKKVSGTHVA